MIDPGSCGCWRSVPPCSASAWLRPQPIPTTRSFRAAHSRPASYRPFPSRSVRSISTRSECPTPSLRRSGRPAASSSGDGPNMYIVDDDLAQCPNAAFTSIQAAVNASGPGDQIKVCPGLYVEQVGITGAAHDGLTLFSQQPLQAIIKAPPVMTDPGDIVRVNGADDVTIRHFTITGPLPDIFSAPCSRGPEFESTGADRRRSGTTTSRRSGRRAPPSAVVRTASPSSVGEARSPDRNRLDHTQPD